MASRSMERNRYFKVKSKMQFVNADIKFLKDCRRLGVFPNFISLKTNYNSRASMKALEFAKDKWLNLEIKSQYSKLHRLELEAYGLHLNLTKNLNAVEYEDWIVFLHNMDNVIQHKLEQKINTHNKKLSKLVPRNPVSQKTNPVSIVKNESSQTFSNEEMNFLNKGLKYNLHFKKPPIDEIINGIETAIRFLDENSKHYVRNACKIEISKNSQRNRNFFNDTKNEYHIIKSLKSKDCFYLKADKGNSLVILDKPDYFNRVSALINEGPYTEIKKNPLPKMIRDTKTVLSISNKVINDRIRFSLTVSNPVLPRMYCLPKIHKEGKSMRPIVSCINSPTYLLSKYLSSSFSSLPNQQENFSVKNSYEFINKIKAIELSEHETLVSFDVTSLFPSVPVELTLGYLKDLLLNNDLDNEEVDQYVNLAKLCMNHNFFQINNKFFQQNEGTAMGNSLSPFMANLFMGRFETDLKNQLVYFPRIWIRYVDDVFAIFDTSKCNIQNFINDINSKCPSIKFTYELEKDNRLPFLDMYVIRNSKWLEIDIYRKKTSVNRFILEESNHCMQHKLANFNWLIHRLFNFPLSYDRFKKELNYIKEVAANNGFSSDLIDNLVRKHRSKQVLRSVTRLESSNEVNVKDKYVKLPFYPKYTNGLKNILGNSGFKMVYSTDNSIKNVLGNPKDPVDSMDKAGIYKISCQNCDQVYVGQTKRSLKVRFKEHLAHVKYRRPDKSSVALHMFENGHKVENVVLIKAVNNKSELNSCESLEIYKHRNNLMNVENAPIYNSKLFELL